MVIRYWLVFSHKGDRRLQILLTHVVASCLVMIRIVFSDYIVYGCDIKFGLVISLILHLNMKVMVFYSVSYIPVYPPSPNTHTQL